ncbi:malate dehydrogenase, partial [bacterium]|nr:malate dehydrogenase [bacterium]
TIEKVVHRTREAGTEIVQLLGNGSAFFSPAWSSIVIAESYLKDKKRILTCAALCEGEYGIHGLFIGVPVRIGADGIEKIYEIKLNNDEKTLLDQTVEAVKSTVAECQI